jgi:hypothetical protein
MKDSLIIKTNNNCKSLVIHRSNLELTLFHKQYTSTPIIRYMIRIPDHIIFILTGIL